LLLFLFASVCLAADDAPKVTHRKRALLVAVNGYARGQRGDAPALDTTADVLALKAVLMKPPFRFAAADITVLTTPKETTGKAIRDAFYEHLIAPTQPGDIVFFHYSGHGSQVPDPKDDRYGYDQTLVPSDYVSKYDGSRDIRDKQIAGWLKDLALRRPGAVLLSFDSCHSGGVTRDGTVVRGFDREIPRRGRTRGGDDPGKPLVGADANPELKYVALAACRYDQVAVEAPDDGRPPRLMGGFTYALCRALSQANERTTYRDLLQQLVSVMREKRLAQDPQIEGPLDTVLLGKDVVRPEPAFVVDLDAHDRPVLQAGFLQGIVEGTQLDLYAGGSEPLKSAPLLAHAVALTPVSTATPLTVIPVNGTPKAKLRLTRAVVRKRQYGDTLLHVDLSGFPDNAGRAALVAAVHELEQNELVTTHPDVNGGWDVRLLPAPRAFKGVLHAAAIPGHPAAWTVTVSTPGGKESGRRLLVQGSDPTLPSSMVLLRRDGSLLTAHTPAGYYAESLAMGNALVETVKAVLLHEARRALLFKVASQDHDPTLQVRLRLVLCHTASTTPDPNDLRNRMWTEDLPMPYVGGLPELPINTWVRVEAQNLSLDPVYLTVLDVTPDGKIGALWPEAEGVDNVIPHCRDDRWVPLRITSDPKSAYSVWHVGDPQGGETLLAIATADQANFTPLLDPDRAVMPDTRIARSPLGLLLRNAVVKRDATSAELDEAGWGVCCLPFHVVPATGRDRPAQRNP
jgi:hypothetical protein